MALDIKSSAARLFVVGFHGKELSKDLAGLLDRGVGGVICFSRNVGAPAEIAALTTAIKRHAGRPVILSVDQEGGNVARLRDGFTPIPPMRALGIADDAELSFEVGRVIGRELRAVGFDLDFAPVLDVDTNPNNPVIGPRSFGTTPDLVAWHGLALMAGLSSAGVSPCGKHFPGHGDTHQDSHLTLPRLPHALERLKEVELVPFRAAIRGNVPALMTAHVIFEPLDATWPATMSGQVLGGLLRDELGYSGLLVTDDLEMKAIADHYPLEEVVVRGLNAGVDLFLCCHTAEKAHAAIDAVEKAIVSGRVPPYHLERAIERIETFCRRWVAPPLERFDASIPGSAEHLAVMAAVERAAGRSAERRDPTEK